MEFVRVAGIAEIPVNTMITVVVDGKEVLLANLDGSYHAVANKCGHAGGSLAKGVLEGGVVTCPKHGARFDVKSGEVVAEARIGFIKLKTKTQDRYTVKVEGADILVGLPG